MEHTVKSLIEELSAIENQEQSIIFRVSNENMQLDLSICRIHGAAIGLTPPDIQARLCLILMDVNQTNLMPDFVKKIKEL